MSEFVLIRMPQSMKPSALDGVKVGGEFSVGSDEWKMTELDKSDAGEMGYMKLLSPTATGYALRSISAFYHVGYSLPDLQEQFDAAAKRVLKREYVPRTHPAGLKLQSLPYGFDTQQASQASHSKKQKSKKKKNKE